MEVVAVAPACGAEVFGVDLGNPSTDAMRVVHQALAEHCVLFFRDQKLSPAQQLELTRRFGNILRVPYIQHLDEYPDIIAVLKEADERKISTFGGAWHSDFSFMDEPPSLTLLYALELPALGGDTLWASQYAAYDALSPGMQKLLDPLRAIQPRWPLQNPPPVATQTPPGRTAKLSVFRVVWEWSPRMMGFPISLGFFFNGCLASEARQAVGIGRGAVVRPRTP